MRISRRQFLTWGGIAGGGAAISVFLPTVDAQAATVTGADAAATVDLSALPPAVFVTSPALSKFTEPLRGLFPLDPKGIAVAVPDGKVRYRRARVVADHYTIDLTEFLDQLHADLGRTTTLWGYHSRRNLGDTATRTAPQHGVGGIIIAQRGKPIQITFRNRLPRRHILPVDPTLMGADGAANRACVHLHGGETPWISDGGPFTWFRPDDDAADTSPLYGPSAQAGDLNIYRVVNPSLQPGQAEHYYPMDQSARFLWYHDHALGTTRLNAYAGLASGVIIRDDFEQCLVTGSGLPKFAEKGGRELVLVIQDKIIQDSAQDPYYPGITTTGSLWYPYRYVDRWSTAAGGDAADLPISCVPEVFGDTMLVNGVAHPVVSVEPRRYRLRILNACQARFLNLQLYAASGAVGEQLPDFAATAPSYLVLGTEGGFLARATAAPSGQRLAITVDPDSGDRTADPTVPTSVLTAPAERWDLVVDFSAFAGKSFILYNDAPAPFPMGDHLNDGPTTTDDAGNVVVLNQMLMRFDVAATTTAAADRAHRLAPGFPLAADPHSAIDPALAGTWATLTTAPRDAPEGVRVRRLTLNELYDEHGRLIQMLGANTLAAPRPGYTLDPSAPGADLGLTTALGYADPVTENPSAGDVEVWEIANPTGDSHPVHFHLVNVQLLARIPFTGYAFDADGQGAPTGLGVPRGPEDTELGWKETVRMHPGEVTRVLMRFDLPTAPFCVPASPRTGGNEFVWHCHILEHEEHDMMRPLVVEGTNPTG